MINPDERDYVPPSTEHLGETARQFEWLQSETQALSSVTRGFSNIVDNARALDPETAIVYPQRYGKSKKNRKKGKKKRR